MADQAFPNYSTPFVDTNGNIQNSWLRLLISLWSRTGGSSSTVLNVVGTPSHGQLTGFVTPLEITGVDLSGDVFTLGNTSTILSNSGITAGTYTLPTVHFDSKGRATSATSASTTGTGNIVYSSSPTLTTPNLGTPSLLVLTNAIGLPLSTGITGTLSISNGGTGITSFGVGVQTALGSGVSGTGNIVLVTSPTLVTPNLGTPSTLILTNATGLPVSSGITGLGSGVATALAANTTGSSGIALSTNPVLTVPITAPSVVASLPTPVSGLKGARSFITDATVTAAGNFGNIPLGGGTNAVPVYCDGASWRIG